VGRSSSTRRVGAHSVLQVSAPLSHGTSTRGLLFESGPGTPFLREPSAPVWVLDALRALTSTAEGRSGFAAQGCPRPRAAAHVPRRAGYAVHSPHGADCAARACRCSASAIVVDAAASTASVKRQRSAIGSARACVVCVCGMRVCACVRACVRACEHVRTYVCAWKRVNSACRACVRLRALACTSTFTCVGESVGRGVPVPASVRTCAHVCVCRGACVL
jgi:hypothetical protein